MFVHTFHLSFCDSKRRGGVGRRVYDFFAGECQGRGGCGVGRQRSGLGDRVAPSQRCISDASREYVVRSVEPNGEGDAFFFPQVLVDEMDGEDAAFGFGAPRHTASTCARSKDETAIADDLKADLGAAAFGGFDRDGA